MSCELVNEDRFRRRGPGPDFEVTGSMTAEEIRAAADRIEEVLERFAPLFGKTEVQGHALTYVKGLMVCPGRKSIEPIARRVGEGRVSGLQKFINIAPWQYDDVQAEIQAVFDERLAGSWARRRSRDRRRDPRVGIRQEGRSSVGIGRQHNVLSGKVENCQVGLFLIGVAPEGTALLDHRLYLPESWCAETEEGRRSRPRSTSRRKSSTSRSPRSPPTWSGRSLFWARCAWTGSSARNLTPSVRTSSTSWSGSTSAYVLEVPGTTIVADPDAPVLGPSPWSGTLNHVPATPRLSPSWASSGRAPGSGPTPRAVPASGRWSGSGRSGSSGQERRPGSSCGARYDRPPRRSSISRTAGRKRPRTSCLACSGARGRASLCLDEARRHFGQGHYETRSWIGWHHHMSLVALAHLVATLSRTGHGSPGPGMGADVEDGGGDPVGEDQAS